VACLLAVAAVAGSAAAQRIPDRLADTTFWRIVSTFSEPTGSFPSDNFVSNENEWQYVIPGSLNRVSTNGAYIGVGPEQNFTYIAAFSPRIAFICDIRRQNLDEHLLYKALLEMSRDRAELLSLLWSRARPDGLDSSSTPAALADAFARAVADTALERATLASVLHRLVNDHGFLLTADDTTGVRNVLGAFRLAGPGISYSSGVQIFRIITSGDTTFRTVSAPANTRASGFVSFARLMLEDDGAGTNRGWLGSEAAFRRVKEYEERNLIVPVVGDFAGPKALRTVGEYLREHDTRVSVFYTSNVEEYLFRDPGNWKKFYASVATLPTDSSSMYIRSVSITRQVMPRKASSILAQTTSSMDGLTRAFAANHIASYYDIIALRDR